MQLLPEERRRLDLIDATLRAEAPALASKFDMFTRLAREDGQPPAEKPFRPDGPGRRRRRRRRRRRYKAFARQRANRYCYAIIVLATAVLTLALTLTLTLG